MSEQNTLKMLARCNHVEERLVNSEREKHELQARLGTYIQHVENDYSGGYSSMSPSDQPMLTPRGTFQNSNPNPHPHLDPDHDPNPNPNYR